MVVWFWGLFHHMAIMFIFTEKKAPMTGWNIYNEKKRNAIYLMMSTCWLFHHNSHNETEKRVSQR